MGLQSLGPVLGWQGQHWLHKRWNTFCHFSSFFSDCVVATPRTWNKLFLLWSIFHLQQPLKKTEVMRWNIIWIATRCSCWVAFEYFIPPVFKRTIWLSLWGEKHTFSCFFYININDLCDHTTSNPKERNRKLFDPFQNIASGVELKSKTTN